MASTTDEKIEDFSLADISPEKVRSLARKYGLPELYFIDVKEEFVTNSEGIVVGKMLMSPVFHDETALGKYLKKEQTPNEAKGVNVSSLLPNVQGSEWIRKDRLRIHRVIIADLSQGTFRVKGSDIEYPPGSNDYWHAKTCEKGWTRCVKAIHPEWTKEGYEQYEYQTKKSLESLAFRNIASKLHSMVFKAILTLGDTVSTQQGQISRNEANVEALASEMELNDKTVKKLCERMSRLEQAFQLQTEVAAKATEAQSAMVWRLRKSFELRLTTLIPAKPKGKAPPVPSS